MDRIENFDEEMIDLGAVSVETKGIPVEPINDLDLTGVLPAGISND